MLSRRDRVMTALNFEEPDRLPKDLGGMLSTGISCFAYPKLVKALGLPERLPRVHDQEQMLALPELDVLDALDCDVVTVHGPITNAVPQPRRWRKYDFNGRLPALVRNPKDFVTSPDGTISQPKTGFFMPAEAMVFNEDHAGQSLDFLDLDELPMKDLKQLRKNLRRTLPKKREIEQYAELFRQIRKSTDRAVMFSGPGTAEIGIGNHGGIALFPMICKFHPDYATEYHEILTENALEKLERILPAIRDGVDVFMVVADDWGTQTHTIASSETFRTLFLPYYRRLNDAIHTMAPNTKTFMHSCGAIYGMLDDIIAAGFDILNPVQWTAGGHSYHEWKAKTYGRIALWGGGVNTQTTLPFGTVEQVGREVEEITSHLGKGGGYIFNAIHNLLSNSDPQKIIAMYQAAGRRNSE